MKAPFDYVNMMMNHGTESIDIPAVSDWHQVLDQARVEASFVGLDEERFPRDFASMINYYTEIQKVPARYPLPAPLTLQQLGTFLKSSGNRYPVEWADDDMPEEAAD